VEFHFRFHGVIASTLSAWAIESMHTMNTHCQMMGVLRLMGASMNIPLGNLSELIDSNKVQI